MKKRRFEPLSHVNRLRAHIPRTFETRRWFNGKPAYWQPCWLRRAHKRLAKWQHNARVRLRSERMGKWRRSLDPREGQA